MRCPYCNSPDSRVLDSRDAPEGIRRRRECSMCGLRFTTYERIQNTALMVAKRDGRREEYNRDKLLRSIQMACVKRPLPTGSIEKLVDDIETQLQSLGRAEIQSVAIGEMVVERLRTLDPVAYIRFASVYRDFADVERFKDAAEAVRAAQRALENAEPSPQLPLIRDDKPRRRRGRKPRAITPDGLPLDMMRGGK